MSIKKQIEFEIGERTYRIITSLSNSYDIHGFNALREKVAIYDDLNSGDKVFVTWSLIPVIRFTDAPDGDAAS